MKPGFLAGPIPSETFKRDGWQFSSVKNVKRKEVEAMLKMFDSKPNFESLVGHKSVFDDPKWSALVKVD